MHNPGHRRVWQQGTAGRSASKLELTVGGRNRTPTKWPRSKDGNGAWTNTCEQMNGVQVRCRWTYRWRGGRGGVEGEGSAGRRGLVVVRVLRWHARAGMARCLCAMAAMHRRALPCCTVGCGVRRYRYDVTLRCVWPAHTRRGAGGEGALRTAAVAAPASSSRALPARCPPATALLAHAAHCMCLRAASACCVTAP